MITFLYMSIFAIYTISMRKKSLKYSIIVSVYPIDAIISFQIPWLDIIRLRYSLRYEFYYEQSKFLLSYLVICFLTSYFYVSSESKNLPIVSA